MTKQEVSNIIDGIHRRNIGRDFSGTVLDDAWAEHMTNRALEFLTEEERKALSQAETQGVDEDALAKGVDAVLSSFIKWLKG